MAYASADLNNAFAIECSWSETSTSTSNNTSNISISGKIWRKTSYNAFSYTGAGSLTVYWHDNRSNQDIAVASAGIDEIGYSVNERSVSGSITVTHHSDGSLSGYAYTHWEKSYNSGYIPPSGNAVTDWVALTTIARASQPSINTWPSNSPDFEIGDWITIHMNRKSSSFTHTVKINYGNTSTTIATGVTDNCTFNTATIADALYALIPNTNRYANTISVTTYSGGTNVGTKTCNYTAWIKADQVKPVFSDFTFADTNSTTTTITGNNQVMISGKSTLAVTISAANKATPQKSATMTKYTFQAAGLTGEEAYTTSAITKTLGSPTVEATELPNGTRDIVVTALDSRSLSTAVTKSVAIVPYSNPKISATATRANGFENSTTVSISGTFSRIEVGGTAKNTVNASSGVQYRYRQQGTSTWGSWTNRTATIDSATGKVTVAAFTLNLDNQLAFEFEFRITDKLATTTVSLTVSVGQPAFYIGADGRVGVGGMPTLNKLSGENGLLEVAGRAFANGHRLLEDDTATVSGSNIDWATAGGQFIECSRQDLTSGSGWTDTNFSSWDKTISVTNGATYAVFTMTEYLVDTSGTTELDLHPNLASGGTKLHAVNSTMTDSHGAPRIALMIIKATSSSIRVQTKVMAGAGNRNLRLYAGGYLVIRIG